MSAGSCRRICSLIIRGLRALPVVIVSAIIVFSYYVYCFQTVIALTNSWLLRGALYVVFHILLVMFLASYFACIFTNIPRIPDRYFLPEEVMLDVVNEKTERARNAILYRYVSQNGLIITNISNTDGPRFCVQCRCIKPDRSHHCSMCGRCVLRYDHHCPWIANCVHLTNYKAFILFLFYGFILCLFALASSLPSFIIFWEGRPLSQEIVQSFGLVFLPFLAFLFGISIACLFFYHVYLVLKNRTTIEQWSPPHFENGPDPNAYNVGAFRNFKQIFGDSKLYWLFPVSSGLSDGLKYPLRAQATVETALNRPSTTNNGVYYSCSANSVTSNGHNGTLTV
ncbi:Palmitoyltransferase [Aphelenchoides besseyi]|nr:Palmitoyltransferase [Aphelenchoides besseyi]